MNVALVGFAVENQATYRYFTAKGINPVICDQNPDIELPEGAQGQLGNNYLRNLDKFDVIVRSVGIHPSVILEDNPSVGAKITTAVNLFFDECKSHIIGITGTKGKGTTSTLIYKILESAGKKVVLAGNIGTPMLDMLAEAQSSDYVVLELSSFQLSDLGRSPHVAVCLMVVPEHLNWHEDMEDYKRAKGNLFRFQKNDDVAIYNGLNATSEEIASYSPAGNKLAYAVPDIDMPIGAYAAYVKDDAIWYKDQEIMKTSGVRLLGRHNLENVCAAIATTYNLIDGNVEAIRKAVSQFAGLPFRLELIRELDGVKYYNDSFSTTPETAIAAMHSFTQPKVVILGGTDKGIPFDEMAKAVTETGVKHVLAIGEQGPVIANLLQNNGFTAITSEGLESMEEIVKAAQDLAAEGDIVLLSTGCASFDMFKDYKDRGNKFNQAVQALS